MKNHNYKILLYSFVIPFLFYAPVCFLIKGFLSIDEVLHYLIMKSASINITNLLSPWGKPPFSTLGYLIIAITGDSYGLLPLRIMNSFIGALSGYIFALILRLEKNSIFYSTIGSYLLMLSQLFLLNSISALTEPLAALILILSYYTYKTERKILSAMLLSFGFLVRLEFVLFIFIFALVQLKRKEYKLILVYFTFPVIWIILLIISNIDPLMILEYNSFLDSMELEFKIVPFLGQGPLSFLYYPFEIYKMVGIVQSVILLLGISFWIKKRKKNFILLGIVCIYFLFEGFILAVPGFGSSGLLRYFVPIIPIITFFTFDGFLEIVKRVSKFLKKKESNELHYYRVKQNIEKTISIIILGLILTDSLTSLFNYIPQTTSDLDIIQIETGDFLEENYDLKNINVYAPILLGYLVSYLYQPSLFFDSFMNSREPDEIVSNYTIFKNYRGFFIGETVRGNLSLISEVGDLVVWSKSGYNNSNFNPIYVDYSKFNIILNTVLRSEQIIIYQKVFS